MLIAVATMRPEFAEARMDDWLSLASDPGHSRCGVDNSVENIGVVASYQWAWLSFSTPIVAYIHDDVEIFEHGWDTRVLREFEDPKVGVVGFGGAVQFGHNLIYKRPYQLVQLARFGYLSNVTNAEEHGDRFTGERDVAVLDGFAMIVRRELLEKAGGWPVDHLTFHMYDAWLCCQARRLGYRVRLVGVKCYHASGGKDAAKYDAWLKERGTDDCAVHREAHKYIYQEFRDVIPIRV